MREIRYRAWDSVQGVMLPVECINFREGTVTLNEGDSSVTDTLEMFQLMQYTGLKDKNGKEIYEGDVIKAVGYKEFIEVVEYQGTAFRAQGDTLSDFYILCDGNIEVIGNIYEHPHLLEGRDEA